MVKKSLSTLEEYSTDHRQPSISIEQPGHHMLMLQENSCSNRLYIECGLNAKVSQWMPCAKAQDKFNYDQLMQRPIQAKIIITYIMYAFKIWFSISKKYFPDKKLTIF